MKVSAISGNSLKIENTSANQTINVYEPMTTDPVLNTKPEVGKIIDKYVLHEGLMVSEAHVWCVLNAASHTRDSMDSERTRIASTSQMMLMVQSQRLAIKKMASRTIVTHHSVYAYSSGSSRMQEGTVMPSHQVQFSDLPSLGAGELHLVPPNGSSSCLKQICEPQTSM